MTGFIAVPNRTLEVSCIVGTAERLSYTRNHRLQLILQNNKNIRMRNNSTSTHYITSLYITYTLQEVMRKLDFKDFKAL